MKVIGVTGGVGAGKSKDRILSAYGYSKTAGTYDQTFCYDRSTVGFRCKGYHTGPWIWRDL